MRNSRASGLRWSLLALTVIVAVGMAGCDALLKVAGLGEATLTVSPGVISLAPQGEQIVSVTAKDKSGNVEGFTAYSVSNTIASTQQLGNTLLKVTAGTQTGSTQIFISSNSGLNKTIQVTVGGGGGGGGVQTPSLSSSYFDSSSVALNWTSVSGATSYTLQRAYQSDYNFYTVYTGSNTYFNDSGLMSSTAYVYHVQATTSSGTSNWSQSYQVTTLASGGGQNYPPSSAPANVTFFTSQYSVNLSWDPVFSAKYYKIERALSPSGGTSATYYFLSNAYGTSYYDSTVSPGTSYQYRITAGNDFGESIYSSVVYPTTQSVNQTASFPSPAVNHVDSYDNVYLYWSPVYDTATHTIVAPSYRVTKWNELYGTNDVIVSSSGSTYFTDYNVLPNTYYYYAVTALDGSNNEQQWAYVTVLTPSNPNVAPTVYPTLTTNTLSDTSIYLYWDSVSGSGINYRVYRDTSYYGTFSTLVYDGPSLAATDTGLSGNTSYYYVIQAYNAYGNGPFSYPTSGYTQAATTAPTAPDTPYLTDRNGNDWIKLAWSSVTGATSYTLEYSYDQTNWNTFGSFATPSAQYSPLSSGSTYYFRVFATNSVGPGAYSQPFSYTAPNWLIIWFN